MKVRNKIFGILALLFVTSIVFAAEPKKFAFEVYNTTDTPIMIGLDHSPAGGIVTHNNNFLMSGLLNQYDKTTATYSIKGKIEFEHAILAWIGGSVHSVKIGSLKTISDPKTNKSYVQATFDNPRFTASIDNGSSFNRIYIRENK